MWVLEPLLPRTGPRPRHRCPYFLQSVESTRKLGRHRWVIERTMAWLSGYRHLTLRYERKATHFPAFRTLGAAITCYKKLAKLAT
ncbi:hypothetical protein CFN78_16530 [Amycolatopsis antarctica]|uniref:Transposase IS4-like domain-containing protein n=1 Tax=Amycolatopsis antarctica TaxID=1854586 RepID=A0A263D136_9PSEU|nr:hypothetical protein CFN78_16530 [Amycolatopsis antarctica]